MIAASGYRVPFDINLHPIEITQSYHGKFSHYKYHPLADYSYALDFGLPFGTPVLASRGGVVSRIFENTKKVYTGLDRAEASLIFANMIEIDHGDDTFSHYQHLAYKFSAELGIKKGMQVFQGQPIAITGPSGWIGPIPHLHFMVYRFDETETGHPGAIETFPVFSEEELAEMSSFKLVSK